MARTSVFQTEYNGSIPFARSNFMIGLLIEFQDEGPGIIDDETVDAIHITSQFFTGWMLKVEYFDLLGLP